MLQLIARPVESADQRTLPTGRILDPAELRLADMPLFELKPASWEPTLCHDSVES
ncbi:hypothetical protein ACFXGA_00835 [Actinosynnema sp. NPDC059335]|uniref:hypothetical protein n=1 Tax=Actinosynnema sp. NPDC059335 TaxID=3346804 RepID=UPI00366E8B04